MNEELELFCDRCLSAPKPGAACPVEVEVIDGAYAVHRTVYCGKDGQADAGSVHR